MKKRLRKKLGVGEFVELGFEAKWQLLPQTYSGRDVYDEIQPIDYEFEALIVGMKLYLWGWGEGRWAVHFLNWIGRGSATEEHRQMVEQWLGQRSDVSRYEVGPLRDARKYPP